jgi:hypothetical protein
VKRALLLLVACSASSGASMAPIPTNGDAATSLCASDPRAQTFASGMEQAGTAGKFKVKLLSISPEPAAQGENRWSIAVADGAGKAVAGATIALVATAIDHGQSPAQLPAVQADPLPGQYTMSKIEIAIPGVWSFAFNVTAAGATDTATFTFCVAD